MTTPNITITLGTATRSTIACISVEDSLTNQITTTFSTPTTKNTNSATTKIGNLLKIVEKFTITGHIVTALNVSASNPTERSNAKDVKNDLKTIFNNRQTCVLGYDGDNYTGVIDTLKITELARNGEEAVDGEIRYNVTLTFIVGGNLVPTS